MKLSIQEWSDVEQSLRQSADADMDAAAQALLSMPVDDPGYPGIQSLARTLTAQADRKRALADRIESEV